MRSSKFQGCQVSVMEDLKGVAEMFDDILVFGGGREEEEPVADNHKMLSTLAELNISSLLKA